MLQQNLTQTALAGLAGSMSDMDYEKQRAVMEALGAGAQYGVLMPFSRNHESEADHIGLIDMARAGYDPRAMVTFLQQLEANEQLEAKEGQASNVPDWLRDHPRTPDRVAAASETAAKGTPGARQQDRSPNLMTEIKLARRSRRSQLRH